MQKRLFALMFALVITAAVYTSPVYAQGTESIGVDVPFAFSANGKALPAGHYLIGPVGDNRIVWGLRGVDIQSHSFLLGMSRTGRSDGKLFVIFHRYGGVNFLAGFKTNSYEINLPTTTAEKTLRLSGGELSQMKVIKLEKAYRASAPSKR